MAQRINVVFQGGGVKGLAFAGALDALENDAATKTAVKIDAVGGVSVGAITAALYAAGYDAKTLAEIVKKKPVASLLNGRMPRTPFGKAWRLWRHMGLFSTNNIYNWVRELLADKGVTTFKDLRMPCRILAANVSDGIYQTYSEADAGEEVASAVLRSLSIPFFFRPYIDGQRLFVDGGLLSNYPLWLFADSALPTVGLQLSSPFLRRTKSLGLIEYGFSLLSTMIGAHDKVGRGRPSHVLEIAIKADFVQSTDFWLAELEQELLYQNGYVAVTQTDWRRLQSPPALFYRDPNAPTILEATAQSINKVFDSLSAVPPRRKYDSYHLTYVISTDGSVKEDKSFTIKNIGTEPISMMRARVTWDYDVGEISFEDLNIIVACSTPSCDVVVLPCQNLRTKKAYVLTFVPPILPGQDRSVVTTTYMPRWLLNLKNGKPDDIGVKVESEGGIVQASLTLHVARSLGTLEMAEAGKTKPNVKNQRIADQMLTYDLYHWDFANIASDLDFQLSLKTRGKP